MSVTEESIVQKQLVPEKELFFSSDINIHLVIYFHKRTTTPLIKYRTKMLKFVPYAKILHKRVVSINF